jgi:regulator of sirC expression with transglutaminase-like and TPR domain
MKQETAGDRRWREIAALPDEHINLAEAALLIATEEYPGLNVEAYLGRIDEMAAVLQRRLRQDISTTDTIIALNHYLFRELGFAGNMEEYYDPRNSFLNDVIDRRLGIPITLSILYLEIGRRIGLPLYGVSFPAHFLVKCTVRDGAIVLDPYAKGASLGLDELRARLKNWHGGIEPDPGLIRNLLVAAGNREILARMLRNLKGIYLRRGDLARALAAANRSIMLRPDEADEYRERAAIYLELECFRAALSDFRRYLTLKPDAPDADGIAIRIGELQRIASRLN